MPKQPGSSKKKILVTGAIVGILGLFGLASSHAAPQLSNTTSSQPTTSASSQNVQADTTTKSSPAPATAAPAAEPVAQPAASSPAPACDGYINVDGNCVQSPTNYDSPPAGATARCGDGTYSFSQHRSGTCSHHGGVAEWL